MNRLIINTANEDLYVLVIKDKKFYSKNLVGLVKHNEALIGCVDGMLKTAGLGLGDIDEFGVVVGPGSFTGIRVGIATIKAFRDATNKKAFGLNNLDLLFALSQVKDKKINVVAIKGSRDSYFVARFVNGVLYKYDHNLTEQELKDIAKSTRVGMFKADENIKSVAVEIEPSVLCDLMDKSTDESLIPVYYQLSQAEREKLNKIDFKIKKASKSDIIKIAELEAASMDYNIIEEKQFSVMFGNKDYLILTAKADKKIVGFILAELTDEANITSLVVDKDFRNLGVATRLVDELKKFSLKRGIDALSLEVKYDNIVAYLLYEKLGFTKRRIRKKYYEDGSDCIEMALKLD